MSPIQMTNTRLPTYLTLEIQEASSVRSEMVTSSLVGVEQAFFLPLLIFSGVFFSSEALSRIHLQRTGDTFWRHLTGLEFFSLRALEDFVAVMYLEDTLQEGRVLFFTD